MRQQDEMLGADSKLLQDNLWNLHHWRLQRLKSKGKLQKINKAMNETAIPIFIRYKNLTPPSLSASCNFLHPTRTHWSCIPALPLLLPWGHALAPGHPSKHKGKLWDWVNNSKSHHFTGTEPLTSKSCRYFIFLSKGLVRLNYFADICSLLLL